MSDQTTTTTIATLKESRQAAPERDLPAVRVGLDSLQSFELAQRAARLLSSSTLVPPQYQGNLPNCVVALNMASRIGADPLMVMQNLYVVHGRPAWSAQFLIASFNQCGRFSAMRYEWIGTEGKDDYGCRAYAVEKATGEKLYGPLITVKLARDEGWLGKQGSKWKTMPQLMLMYRAASWLVRTYAPEIAMGLQTAEEIHDVYDAAPDESGDYSVKQESEHEEPKKRRGRPPKPRDIAEEAEKVLDPFELEPAIAGDPSAPSADEVAEIKRREMEESQ